MACGQESILLMPSAFEEKTLSDVSIVEDVHVAEMNMRHQYETIIFLQLNYLTLVFKSASDNLCIKMKITF